MANHDGRPEFALSMIVVEAQVAAYNAVRSGKQTSGSRNRSRLVQLGFSPSSDTFLTSLLR